VRELSFDIPLSRRVREEIEDHFCEAAADDLGGDSIEAQRRAIARFGDPREIARQYAASSLLKQTRRVGFVAILALVGIYIAMKGRGAWYGLMQWGLSDHFKDVATTWISIEHASSHLTRRWSKPDSNSRSHLRRCRCQAQEYGRRPTRPHNRRPRSDN
jgi:hypothetical protein